MVLRRRSILLAGREPILLGAFKICVTEKYKRLFDFISVLARAHPRMSFEKVAKMLSRFKTACFYYIIYRVAVFQQSF